MYGCVGLYRAMKRFILTNVKPLYDAYTAYLPFYRCQATFIKMANVRINGLSTTSVSKTF